MKKEYNLIKYSDVDQKSLGPQVEFYLSLLTRKKAYKIFGTNEKGIIILVPEIDHYSIQYIYVREEFRHQGVCRALIDSVCVYCVRYHYLLELNVIFNSPFAEALERYAIERKMILSCTQRLFILQRTKLENDNGIWIGWIDGRLSRISQRLLDKGYLASSFQKAPKSVLEKLKKYCDEKMVPGWETPRDMNPFHHNMDLGLSFICWKDDEPVSYICIVRYGDSVVVKEHFCFRKYFSSGVSAIPLSFFAEAVREDSSILRISFMILETNVQASRMMSNNYSNFHPKVTLRKEYMWNGIPVRNN